MVKLTVLWEPEDPAAFEEYYANTHMALVDKIPSFQRYEVARIIATARRYRVALLPRLRDLLR
jgi:uncharacterized protein (TIGR02118 family)